MSHVVLNPERYAWHGPEFALVLYELTKNFISKEISSLLLVNMAKYNVEIAHKIPPISKISILEI